MFEKKNRNQNNTFFFQDSNEQDRELKYRTSIDYLEQENEKNEENSNRAIAYTTLLYIIMPIALELATFYDDAPAIDFANKYVFFPLAVVILIVLIIARTKNYKGKWIKYVLIGEIAFGAISSFFLFSTTASYVLFLPLFCAMRYFSHRLMKLTEGIMAVFFLLGCVLSVYLDIKLTSVSEYHWSTVYNVWEYPVDVVLYMIIPILLVACCIAFYTREIIRAGKGMLQKQAVFTETEIMVISELKTAADIQLSGLPKEEMLTVNRNFAITGKSISTRIVGGDFYDYFMIDDHTLCFLIADVSDKGLPAAMFMMACRKAVRCAVECVQSLDKAIELANRLICEDNEMGMFITMWIGMIDIHTGVGKYANAGHLYPMIRHADGSVSEIANEPSLFMGNFPEMPPEVHPFRLQGGEELLLYTDGMTDAVNAEKENFGAGRLKKEFQGSPADPKEIRDHLIDRELKFSNGAEQVDDMTMLILKCYDIDEPERFTMLVQSGKKGTEEIIETIQKKLEAQNCPDEKRRNICVILDELLSNISEYAYEKEGEIFLKCMIGENFIRFDLEDEGVTFNPLLKEDPAFPEEPEIGGLGIWLVRNLSDEVSYKNINGKNRITVKVIWNM